MVAEPTPVLCRNGPHPIALRVPNGADRTECGPCRKAVSLHRWQVLPGGRRRWANPEVDADQQARYQAWAAGLDDAIAQMRREQGFDGRERTWRTLGDVVGMQAAPPAPAPEPVVPQSWRTRRIVACPDCGAGRFEGRPCRHCEPRSARFQALAALDVGRLFDLDPRT